jgi:hypothetical protein
VFDADEFLASTTPPARSKACSTTRWRGANGVVITWRIFGSGGVIDWSRAPVTEQYTRAAPPLWNKGWGVKTLFSSIPNTGNSASTAPRSRTSGWKPISPTPCKWLNGSGLPMEDYFKFRGWRSIRRTLGYDWAQMNHYAVKSVDSLRVRKFRGNVNNKKDKYNAEYWALQDRNEVEDRAILRHAERPRPDHGRASGRPGAATACTTALDRVEARLADFRETDAYARLRDGLIEASKVPITEVEAKPPKARDPAKIAALMSRVEPASPNAKTAPTAAACNSTGRHDRSWPRWALWLTSPKQGDGRVSETDDTEEHAPGHGVVVRAPNGDVIRYDPSGLVMRLSDKVIEDIALRLGTAPRQGGGADPMNPPMKTRFATSTHGTSGPRATGSASRRGWPVGRACAASGAMCRVVRSSATGRDR